jgi:hypothetical protein
MKTRISLGLVALAVLLMAFAAVAYGATAHTSKGSLTHFRYNADKKVGILTVTAKQATKFRLPASTDCGVSYGQSGDQIPCKSLGKSKYAGKPVTVKWKKNASGSRIASLVAVDLSK